jgi:tRNA (cmo5U34)-methyltransferase
MSSVVGDGIQSGRSEWKFDAAVAEVFDSHVGKSVPFYEETEQLSVSMSDWFLHDASLVYDLGCATGTTFERLLTRHPNKSIQCVGIDNSEAMLNQARARLGSYSGIKLVNEDLLDHSFKSDISLIYSLYTLMFIPAQQRIALCKKLYESLAKRGALILVEKVLDDDAFVTDVFTHLHWSKKAEMGFDVTEIYGKAQALRGVLVPFTLEENIDMLRCSGFSRISVFFKWCNFCGIVATK